MISGQWMDDTQGILAAVGGAKPQVQPTAALPRHPICKATDAVFTTLPLALHPARHRSRVPQPDHARGTYRRPVAE